MNEKPSFLTSTTAFGFLIVVLGYVGTCIWKGDVENLWRLVQMYVPGYLTVKGFQMGQKNHQMPSETPPDVQPPQG